MHIIYMNEHNAVYKFIKKILKILFTMLKKYSNIAVYIFSFFYLTRFAIELIEGQGINQINLLLLAVAVAGAFYGWKHKNFIHIGIGLGILSKFFILGYL